MLNWKVRIFGGSDDAEARRSRPVDHFGGQRRLVAIGQRIHHAGFARLLGEQRPRQHVGLDIDHHDVLAGSDRGPCVTDADGRIAGRLHDDVDAICRRSRAIGGKRRRRDPGVVPADGLAGVPGALRIEIDDDGDFKSRHMRHLRQEHRAELAGADQRDTDRLAGGAAGVEEMMEIHVKRSNQVRLFMRSYADGIPVMAGLVPAIHVLSSQRSKNVDARHKAGHDDVFGESAFYSAACRCARASRSSASSSTVSIGAKSRCAMNSGRVGVRM